MAFPTTTYTDNESAGAALTNNAAAAGLNVSGLQPLAQVQSVVANMLLSDPTTVNIPAGDVLSGTFGANKTGGADTGTYTFPGAVAVTGAVTGVTTIVTSGLATIGAGVDLTGACPVAAASHVTVAGNTRTTIGANGAATALTANPLGYLDINVAGTIAQIPYYSRGA